METTWIHIAEQTREIAKSETTSKTYETNIT